MKTPNTIEAVITEDIMRRISRFPWTISANDYNRMYEAVLDSLQANLSAARQAPPNMTGEEFAGIQRVIRIVQPES